MPHLWISTIDGILGRKFCPVQNNIENADLLLKRIADEHEKPSDLDILIFDSLSYVLKVRTFLNRELVLRKEADACIGDFGW